ncbi:aminotransferase class IV [Belliella marina]|uniref:branched-chain-amino-acid transaminase n=1 Tax=Belliella marina TaxID=1644146 RepID=A0ABW4VSW0_9BACT
MTENDTISWEKDKLSEWVTLDGKVSNRAFLFADGLFETMVYIKGNIRFAEMHFERLVEGCRVLGLSTENLSSMDQISHAIREKYGERKVLRIRWNVYRAGKGKYTPQSDDIEETLHIQEFLPAPSVKQSAYVHPEIVLNHSPWSHCKTLNALTYVIANRDRALMGMDEVLLLTAKGFVAEAGASNLFWTKSGVFYTPTLATGCIAGVARRAILEYLENKGVEIREGYFGIGELYQADAVFVSNVAGISYLSYLEGKKLGQHTYSYLNELFDF